MSRYVNDLSSSSKEHFDKKAFKAEKNIQKDQNLRGEMLDPKRQISYKEKEAVWNKATSHPSFDSDIFRCDPFGAVAVKGLNFKTTICEAQRKFVFDYEHIVSHSQFGKSVPGNICILNAGINRSKGPKPMTDVKFYEFKGLVSHYGVSFNELLDELENELHSTCEHFNLYFYKNNQAKWSIHRDNFNYKSYIQGKNYKPKPFEIEIGDDPVANAGAVAAVAGATLAVANFIGEHVCIFSGNVVFFMDKTFNEQPKDAVVKPKQEPTKPDTVKNTAIGLGVLAVAAAVLAPCINIKQRSTDNRRRRRR